MLGLYYNVVLMCVISTAMCSPMPQHLFEDGPFKNQQKHAIDFFSTRLVGNPKVRRNYLNCFLDNGPCSPEAKNIKRMVPDAIKNECEHCTDLQRKVIEKMMCYLNNNQPEILKQVAAKFDPNGEYMKQYINKIENDQFLNPELQRPPKNQFQPQPQQPKEQDKNQQQPHQNEHRDQNQPDQDQNKNHHFQSDHQPPQQNQQPPNQQQPPSHHHHQQQPQNTPQQQPQNTPQQQPQNTPQQHPQQHNQQQPQQNQQQPHHHHHPQQPQQNQQPQQH